MSAGGRTYARGFTLIEMMLAVMILGLVLVMLAESFHVIAQGKLQAESRLDVDHEGRAILWALSNELRDAVQTLAFTSRVLLIGRGQMRNSTPLDNLTVSTLDLSRSPSLDGFGSEEVVSYTTAPNPDHHGWFLLMRTGYNALLTTPPSTPPVVLAGNLLALHIRYFDGSIWHESWDSSSMPPGRQLPIAVQVEVTMAASNGRPVRFSTQIDLPMALLQW